MKGWDLENFCGDLQNGVKLRYHHIFLLSKFKKLISFISFFVSSKLIDSKSCLTFSVCTDMQVLKVTNFR